MARNVWVSSEFFLEYSLLNFGLVLIFSYMYKEEILLHQGKSDSELVWSIFTKIRIRLDSVLRCKKSRTTSFQVNLTSRFNLVIFIDIFLSFLGG